MRNEKNSKLNKNRGCRSPILGWLAALLIAIVFILYACLEDRIPRAEQVDICDPTDHATLEQLDPIRVADNSAYVPNQIILTGSEADIERVWEVAVGNVPELGGTACLNKIAIGDDNDRLDSDLYEVPAGIGEWEAVAAIYEAAIELSADGEKVRVFADPNYVIGMSLEGDPVNGHGGLIGSIDIDGGVAAAAVSAPLQQSGGSYAAFARQWAFEQMSGGLPSFGGEGIEVAIFDTASYDAGEHTVGATDGYEGFNLTVQEPVELTIVGLDTTMQMFEKNDVSDHGVFAAGLVNGMAPDSDIVLIRVLNDTGQGTLRDLLAGLEAYGTGRIANNQSLNNTIINLSLGLGYKRPMIPAEVSSLMDQMARFDDPICQEYLAEGNRVPSLQNQLAKMRDAGAVIIAASGNDSLHEPFQPMQNPANFNGVVGVAATNIEGGPSCFTNAGQLSAPGGDGDMGGGLCQPKQITQICAAQGGECAWALISTVNPATYPSGYAYWVGTSFSTPMVSGLAAQILAGTAAATPTEVEQTLMCAATGAMAPLPVASELDPTGAGMPTLNNALGRLCSG